MADGKMVVKKLVINKLATEKPTKNFFNFSPIAFSFIKLVLSMHVENYFAKMLWTQLIHVQQNVTQYVRQRKGANNTNTT